ncbi:MAG: EscR/YscR/HrcR family type III secretion system export apparatus protein, partial [Acetatifactor sp.]|nr:EscR/YscR/HrcR family type III secretion system export apparatus protein [Acetatifactor sp.]
MTNNYKRKRNILYLICLLITVGILCIHTSITVYAMEDDQTTGSTDESTIRYGAGEVQDPEQLQELNVQNRFVISIDNGNGQVNGMLRILIILTLIALAPTLLLTLTAYTRTIIVLHFTRAALNTQTAPPNQVLIGIALFLTLFIMQPTLERVYNEAIVPLDEGTITQEEAFEAGIQPFREFMYRETLTKDVDMFMDIAGQEWDGVTLSEIPTSILVPSFIVGELRQAFSMGFIIYIPFIVIDMVVASTLMSMGMM